MERKSRKINTISSSIQGIAEAVQKKFGDGAMTTLSESNEFATVTKFISLGHWGLNKIISGSGKLGGVPCGRLTEIYGKWSSGKSLLIAAALGTCQKSGGISALDDLEHAYLKEFGEIVGVNNDELLYTASETIEECMDKAQYTVNQMISANPFGIYAIDSIALVQSAKEQEGTVEDSGGYGTEKAKALHQGSRKLVSLIGKSQIALVIANQTRQKLGISYGDSETTTGGDAVPFWASVRIRLSTKSVIRKDKDKKDSEILGVQCEALVKKNKIARPFRHTTFDIMFDEGIRYASGCVDILLKENLIVETAQGWYEYNGKKYRKTELEDYFEANPDKLDELG